MINQYKIECFNIKIIKTLSENETRRMRLHKARDLNEILLDNKVKGYILPLGAKFLIK